MIKPNDLVDNLNRLIINLKSVEIIFISCHSQKGKFIYESHYPALGRELNSQMIEAIVLPLFDTMREMDLECYDPISTLDSCMQYIEIDKVGEAGKVLENLNGVHSSDDFSIQNIDNGRLVGYCIKLTDNNNNTVYLFKKLTNSKLLEKKKFLCFYMGATLEKMTSQPLIIDERIDFLIYESGIYILNTYFFEVFFKINDEYRKKVNSILKVIENARAC